MPSQTPCDVLIVEDNPQLGDEMAGFIGRTGAVIRLARDGASALQLAAESEPRVLLLDYNLPDMTGLQLAERLRPALPSAAMIMMSGRIDGMSEKTLQTLGITVFLNKPVPLGLLRQAVVRLLNGSTAPAGRAAANGWLSAGLGGVR